MPAQSVFPDPHWHSPPLQVLPPPQATPTQLASVQEPWKQTLSGSQPTAGQSFGRHWPVAHRWVDGQALPQLPQLALSVLVLAQVEPHCCSVAAQPQAPPWQVWVEAQTTPTQARSRHMPW